MRFKLFTDLPLRLQYRVALPLLALLFIFLIYLVVRSYRRHRGGLSPKWLYILLAIRIAAVVVLFLSILKPVIGDISERRQQGRVAVFIDNSRSMEVQDAISESSRLRSAKWYLFDEGKMRRRISRYFDLDMYLFGEDVAQLDSADGTFPQPADATDIGEVIATINDLRRSDNLMAAIILTDGSNNVRDDDYVLRESITAPVFPVGIGRKESGALERVDLGVNNILSKKVVLQKTKTPVNFSVTKQNIGPREIRVTVVDENNQLAVEKMITLPEGNGEFSFNLDLVPETKGIHRYKLSVPVMNEETITANNSRYFTMNVIDPRMNVLYFEGRPRYELKFIRRTLEESPNIHLYSIVRTSEDYYYVQGTTPELPLTEGFPGNLDELNQFSVLILGTGGTSVLSEEDIANIVRYVEDGKGLIILGSDDLASFEGTALEKIIPLRLAKGRTSDEFTLELTQEGARHPILSGYEEEFSSRPELGQFSGRVLTGTAKPGASILARGDGDAVIAVQNYGKGHVMIITADNTWKWYMQCSKLGQDSLYTKFWLQSIQWAAGFESVEKDKQFPIVFYTAKDYYSTGETVDFQLQTSEDIAKIDVTLRRSGSDVDKVEMKPEGSDGNSWSSEIKLDDNGEYEIQVEYQGEARSIFFTVGEPLREILDTRLNEELLKRIAYSSGGRYFDISERTALIDALRSLVVRSRRVEEEFGIWDTPWPFVLFTLLVATEWFLRRTRQLV